jgi:hypothetical protein
VTPIRFLSTAQREGAGGKESPPEKKKNPLLHDTPVSPVSPVSPISPISPKPNRSLGWATFGDAPRKLGAWRKLLRQRAGEFLAASGFIVSATTALWTHGNDWRQSLARLRVATAALPGLGTRRLRHNWLLLARIQGILRRESADPSTVPDDSSPTTWVPSVPQALRYAQLATAVYGDAMMQAAQLAVTGRYDSRWWGTGETTTIARASAHTGIPPSDFVVWDVDYRGSDLHLRHLVAVNHAHQEVVLSLRGTFSLAELVIDTAGHHAPFCGGQAHAEMAQQAVAIWKTAGPPIRHLLQEHSDYKLVLTGHSLGAGTACLLHVMLQEDALLPLERTVQCVAFASPPVFCASHEVSPRLARALASCVHIYHQDDCVPFLSLDSVHHLLAALAAVDTYTGRLSWWERRRLVRGDAPLPPAWIRKIQDLAVPAASSLGIPAGAHVWLTTTTTATASDEDHHEHDDDAIHALSYQAHRVTHLATTVAIHGNMWQDHFPPAYTAALASCSCRDCS